MSDRQREGLESFDYFVSRRGSARKWTLEVLSVLEEAGRSFRIQDKDIRPGDNFVDKMNKFVRECRDCIAILTKDYFDEDGWAKDEWTAFQVTIRGSEGRRRLIPLRFDDFQPDGMNGPIVYIDLVGLSKAKRRKAILNEIAGLPPPSPAVIQRPPLAPSKLHHVPPQNLGFVGRRELLDQLHQKLIRKKNARVAVQGLGGVGKTSLVTEYVYRYGAEYAGVWWAQAETRDMLIASLAELDSVLDDQRPGAPRPQDHAEQRARSAMGKLAACPQPWLLIYDNAERPNAISEFFPRAGARLLITTQSSDWSEEVVEFPLETLDELEACRLLLKITRLKDNPGAIRLAKALGYLPLALSQAAAYIKIDGMTFDEYSERIDNLIVRGSGRSAGKNVAATFTLAIERAANDCADALKLLSFFSVLGADHIPRDLADDAIVAADTRDDARMALASVSLIQYGQLEGGKRHINVHRLVQASMRSRLGPEGIKATLESAIACLSRAFPTNSYVDQRQSRLCRQLLPHVLALREHARKAKVESEDLARLLASAASYQLTLSLFAESKSLLKEAIAIAEHVLGADHDLVGKLLYDLGNVFLNAGEHKLAKKSYNEGYAIRLKTLPVDDIWFAWPLANLGYAETWLGEFKRAEGFFSLALERAGQRNGIKSYLVATTLHKYGFMFWRAKQYDEAERRIRGAIAMGKAVKADPMRIYDWQADLGNVLRDVGRFDEAERLYREAIKGLDEEVGDDYSATSWARLGYAELLLKAKRLKEAEAMASRAVEVQRHLFGRDHRWALEATAVLDQVQAAQRKGSDVQRAPAKRAAGRGAGKAGSSVA